eukprot:2800864-Amphidinium_carterae.1
MSGTQHVYQFSIDFTSCGVCLRRLGDPKRSLDSCVRRNAEHEVEPHAPLAEPHAPLVEPEEGVG